MCRHRRRLLTGLGLLAVLIAVVYFFWPSPAPSPWDRMSSVQVGDTRSQLYATLGGPPGDYRRDVHAGVSLESHEQQIGAEMWSSDGGMVYIWLDGDDRVIRIHSLPSVIGPSLIKSVLGKFGL